MDHATKTFCNMIRNRSEENRLAIKCFDGPNEVMSPAISILRQELDSMVRVIYLLSIKDISDRRRLIASTLRGEKWKRKTLKGKWKDVTDREMVELSQTLQGWTLSVYKFSCAFIHLSNFHNHLAENPFAELPETEKRDILIHMRNYHGGPSHDDPDLFELVMYLPGVFDKISSNLDCYLRQLERDENL